MGGKPTVPACDDSSAWMIRLRGFMLYTDARGVYRVYPMSLGDGVWKMWREAPGFFQRFTGTVSRDGNTITSCWEKSRDGSRWEHDFDVTYTKVQ